MSVVVVVVDRAGLVSRVQIRRVAHHQHRSHVSRLQEWVTTSSTQKTQTGLKHKIGADTLASPSSLKQSLHLVFIYSCNVSRKTQGGERVLLIAAGKLQYLVKRAQIRTSWLWAGNDSNIWITFFSLTLESRWSSNEYENISTLQIWSKWPKTP